MYNSWSTAAWTNELIIFCRYLILYLLSTVLHMSSPSTSSRLLSRTQIDFIVFSQIGDRGRRKEGKQHCKITIHVVLTSYSSVLSVTSSDRIQKRWLKYGCRVCQKKTKERSITPKLDTNGVGLLEITNTLSITYRSFNLVAKSRASQRTSMRIQR